MSQVIFWGFRCAPGSSYSSIKFCNFSLTQSRFSLSNLMPQKQGMSSLTIGYYDGEKLSIFFQKLCTNHIYPKWSCVQIWMSAGAVALWWRWNDYRGWHHEHVHALDQWKGRYAKKISLPVYTSLFPYINKRP